MLPFVKPYRKVKTTSIPYVFNFRLTSLSDSESNPGECVSLTAELAAHKEKLQRETITLWDGNDSQSEVRVVLQGRVLGE